jgi:hypothetical protein
VNSFIDSVIVSLAPGARDARLLGLTISNAGSGPNSVSQDIVEKAHSSHQSSLAVSGKTRVSRPKEKPS